jgi:hypothetical protein
MTWWWWVLGGLALAAVELFTPGTFFIVFFGAGAIVVGALLGIGVRLSSALQWLVFSLVSVGSLLVFRGRLLAATRGAGGGPVDSIAGEVAVLLDDLAPGAVGKAELRGTAWNARSAGGRALRRGERVRVERVEGLMLWVRPE